MSKRTPRDTDTDELPPPPPSSEVVDETPPPPAVDPSISLPPASSDDAPSKLNVVLLDVLEEAEESYHNTGHSPARNTGH